MKAMIRKESDRDLLFAEWVAEQHGAENILQCIQCGTCSGSCPLSSYMDYSPRQLIHMSKEGFKEDVLGSFTIWLCTSCYACTVECPRDIKVTDVIYAFKRRAIEEGRYPKRMAIPMLAREFGKMVRAHGRVSEGMLVFRLFLKTNLLRLASMGKLGTRLLRTGRFTARTESIERKGDLAKILDRVVGTEKEVA